MGHLMETLDMSERLLCKGIEEINQKGDLNASNLELLGNAVDALKDIQKIRDMESGGRYSRYMDDGYQGGRRRDSMGRYMDDGYGYDRGHDRAYRESYGEERATYRDSYGEDREEERRRLEMKMRNAQSEREREMYRQKLESM